MNNKAENIAYIIIVTLQAISLLQITSVRYAFYFSPVFAFIIWIFGSSHSISSRTSPFILLLIVSIPSVYDLDFYSFKMSYFIFVYAFIFSIFDFSKIEINFNKLLFLLFVIFLVNIFLWVKLSDIKFSIINSESTFENTLAFPVGVIAMYFFMSKKYFSFVIAALLSIIMLKRIVILALVISIIPRIFGEKIQSFLINPLMVTIYSCIALIFTVEFANGFFDDLVRNFFNMSSNELSKGRQMLWHTTLAGLHFNYMDFAFWGVGQGKATILLDNLFQNLLDVKGQDVRLHNDLLLILLQFGWLVFMIFVFLFNNHKSINKRTLSLFITIIFFTDNVMIYQHVMVFYFLILSQLERIEKNIPSS